MNHKIIFLQAGLIIAFTCISCKGAGGEQRGTPFYLATISSLEPFAVSIAASYNDAFPQIQPIQVVVLEEKDLWNALDQNQVQAVIHWKISQTRSVFIGWTAMVFINHPSNPVRDLSKAQVENVFEGQTHRWEDLGGASEEIHVVSYERDLELFFLFEETILGQSRLTNNAYSVTTSYAMRETVIHDVLSIGYLLCFDLSPTVQTMTSNGIQPDYAGLKNGSYPFRVPVFLDFADATAEKANPLAGWLQSDNGEKVVAAMCNQEMNDDQ